MSDIIQDSVRFQREDYSMIWATGSELFDPAQVNIKPVAWVSLLPRGFHCTYEIDDDEIFLTRLAIRGENQASYPAIGGVEPTFNDVWGPAMYNKIRLPVPFSGMLLIGREPLGNYAGGGVCPYDWREIRECLFTRGTLDRDVDHSAVFERMRETVERQVADVYKTRSEELTPGLITRNQELTCSVIQGRLTPNHWWEDLSWAYETVRALESGSSLVVEEQFQLLEEGDRWRREQQREMEEQVAERERIARQLFARIERDGWDCTHCGRHGVAHEDFRLSIGPASYVICRKCGWVQEL